MDPLTHSIPTSDLPTHTSTHPSTPAPTPSPHPAPKGQGEGKGKNLHSFRLPPGRFAPLAPIMGAPMRAFVRRGYDTHYLLKVRPTCEGTSWPCVGKMQAIGRLRLLRDLVKAAILPPAALHIVSSRLVNDSSAGWQSLRQVNGYLKPGVVEAGIGSVSGCFSGADTWRCALPAIRQLGFTQTQTQIKDIRTGVIHGRIQLKVKW